MSDLQDLWTAYQKTLNSDPKWKVLVSDDELAYMEAVKRKHAEIVTHLMTREEESDENAETYAEEAIAKCERDGWIGGDRVIFTIRKGHDTCKLVAV